jgi:hypothetical protein
MPRSEIMIDGRPTGKVLDGAILEMAVQCDGFRLAFLTDDILHEETLRIYLLDANLNVIDWARLGAMYATGAFSLTALRPPNRICFHFFGGAEWTLEWRSQPAFAVPIVSDPRGVRRPWRWWRRLRISGRPEPEREGKPGR